MKAWFVGLAAGPPSCWRPRRATPASPNVARELGDGRLRMRWRRSWPSCGDPRPRPLWSMRARHVLRARPTASAELAHSRGQGLGRDHLGRRLRADQPPCHRGRRPDRGGASRRHQGIPPNSSAVTRRRTWRSPGSPPRPGRSSADRAGRLRPPARGRVRHCRSLAVQPAEQRLRGDRQPEGAAPWALLPYEDFIQTTRRSTPATEAGPAGATWTAAWWASTP